MNTNAEIEVGMKRYHRRRYFNVCTSAAAIKKFFDKSYSEASARLMEYPEIRVHKAHDENHADYVLTILKGRFGDLTIDFIESYIDALTKFHMPMKDKPLLREDILEIEKSVTDDVVYVRCGYYYGVSEQ